MAEPNFTEAELQMNEVKACVDRAFGELAPPSVGEAPNYLLESMAAARRALHALGVPGYEPNEAATAGGE